MNLDRLQKEELRARFEGVVIEFLLPERERELLKTGVSVGNIVKLYSKTTPPVNVFDMLNALVRVVEDFDVPHRESLEVDRYDPA